MSMVATAESDIRTLIPQKHGGSLWPGARKGEVRNPTGRPKAGAVVAEWLDSMANWTTAEVQAIVDDPEAPMAKRQAAIDWLASVSQELDASGRLLMGSHADRIHDRTVGKAKQDINTTTTEMPSIVGLSLDPQTIRRLPPEQLDRAYAALAALQAALDNATPAPTLAMLADSTAEATIDGQELASTMPTADARQHEAGGHNATTDTLESGTPEQTGTMLAAGDQQP